MNKYGWSHNLPDWQIDTQNISACKQERSHSSTQLMDRIYTSSNGKEMFVLICFLCVHQYPPSDVKQFQSQACCKHLYNVTVYIRNLRGINVSNGLNSSLLAFLPLALMLHFQRFEVSWKLTGPLAYL